MPKLRVQGLAELRRALQATSVAAPKALAKANKQVGQIVVNEAKRRAPRGKHEGGGNVGPLTASIKASLTQTRVRVTAGGGKAPYGAAIEFGGNIPRRGFKGMARRAKVRALLTGGTGMLTHISARPYLTPAVDAKLADVVIAYERMLDELKAKFIRTT